MTEGGDLDLKNYVLKPRCMDSAKKDCVKGKRKLKHFLGFTKISVVSKSGIPEIGKRNLEKVVSKQSSEDSCVTNSSKITGVVSHNPVNDGLPSLGSGIASQNDAVEDVPDLKEESGFEEKDVPDFNKESELASFRRAATMLFFEGENNCRHVVPIGSMFQAEIPRLESEYAENKRAGTRCLSRNLEKSRRRVNKLETYTNYRDSPAVSARKNDLNGK